MGYSTILLRRPSRKNGSQSMRQSAFTLRRTITDVRVFAFRMKSCTRCERSKTKQFAAFGCKMRHLSSMQFEENRSRLKCFAGVCRSVKENMQGVSVPAMESRALASVEG